MLKYYKDNGAYVLPFACFLLSSTTAYLPLFKHPPKTGCNLDVEMQRPSFTSSQKEGKVEISYSSQAVTRSVENQEV